MCTSTMIFHFSPLLPLVIYAYELIYTFDVWRTVMPSANRTWLPLNRPHGACSSPRAADYEDAPAIMVDNLLLWDQLRTDYIRQQLSNGTTDTELPINGNGGDATSTNQVDGQLRATPKIGPPKKKGKGVRVQGIQVIRHFILNSNTLIIKFWKIDIDFHLKNYISRHIQWLEVKI